MVTGPEDVVTQDPARIDDTGTGTGIGTGSLGALLDTLTALTTELEALLAAERERLIARDWDAVLNLSTAKESLVQRLQAQARELEAVCGGQPPGDTLARAGLSVAYAELRDRSARLQRANRESRALLDHHRARVDTALRLMNRGDAIGLYGRDGYAGAGSSSRRLASA